MCSTVKVLKASYTLFSFYGAQIFNNRPVDCHSECAKELAAIKTALYPELNTFY
jgi:hypothetical protein